jgi:hypothetical protein
MKVGKKNLLLDISAFFLAITFIIIYAFDIVVPISFPLITLFVFVSLCLFSSRFAVYNFLVKIMVLFYFFPIVPLYGYLISSDYEWTWLPHQRIALTDDINLKIALVGVIGILGIFGGMCISRNKVYSSQTFVYPKLRILTKSKFIVWSGLCVFLSYLSAPANTIFEGAYYGEGFTKVFAIPNFNAGYLVSYIIACFLYLDYERDTGQNRRLKKNVWYLSFLIIVIYYQALRGDREFIGLLLGFALIKIYEPFRKNISFGEALNRIRTKVRKYSLISISLVLLLLYIGIVRFSAVEGSLLITGLFMHAPWTMATLSFLAFFSTEQLTPLSWGLTYLDYILSIVPTFVYSLFGLDSPSWSNNLAAKLVDTNLTSGGVHVSLVSLSNFGIFGVYLVMCIYGSFASMIERIAIQRGSIFILLWIGLVVSVPFWFWYGEMAAIRGVMAASILFFLLKIRISS